MIWFRSLFKHWKNNLSIVNNNFSHIITGIHLKLSFMFRLQTSLVIISNFLMNEWIEAPNFSTFHNIRFGKIKSKKVLICRRSGREKETSFVMNCSMRYVTFDKERIAKNVFMILEVWSNHLFVMKSFRGPIKIWLECFYFDDKMR